MLTASTKDARNIYLTINEQDQDAQQQKDWSSSYSHSESTVGDASATGYGVVAFQNCYLNSENTNTIFVNLINASSTGRDYSRYLFFYLINLISYCRHFFLVDLFSSFFFPRCGCSKVV